MKVCTVRRRFWATEADNAVINIDTEPNFGTPKAAILNMIECSAGVDAFDTTLANRNLGIIFVGPKGDGSGTIFIVSATSVIADGAADASCARRTHNSEFQFTSSTGGVIQYRANNATFVNDGMTLTFANQTPQSNGHIEAICTFFTGDDLTAGISTHAVSTAANTANSFTGFNFQPDAMFFASSVVANVSNTNNDDFRISWGAATRLPFKQFVVGYHSEGTGAVGSMDLAAWSSNDSVVYYNTNTGVSDANWSLNSIDATGFTITTDATISPGTTNIVNFLALKSSTPTDFALVSFSSATANGNQFTGLGITGFVPKSIIGGSTNATAFNTRQTATPGTDCISMFGGSRSADSIYFPGLGTLTSSTANATLTGTGTSFFRMAPGFKIYSLQGQLIGTVSTVTSATSITLVANAAITQTPTAGWVYSDSGAYCLSFGDLDGSTTSTVHSRITPSLFATVDSNTPSVIDRADLIDFDTRPGFNLNFTTSSGSAKLGWIMAIKDSSSGTNRRRGIGFPSG
jgi:hypothetical protein